MFHRRCAYLIGMLGICSFAFAEEQLKVGNPAPTSIVAEFITGDWTFRNAACPVLLHPEAEKVAIFVRRLDDSVVPLIEKIEEIVAVDPSLKWSFVFVSHENSPTPSQEEWDTLVAQIKKLTEEKMIQYLSVGVMRRIPDPRNSRAIPQLGFLGEGEVVVMLIRPDSKLDRGVIHFLKKIKSDELNEQSIREIKGQIEDALSASSD